jgi:4-carboxymuconolactone decarboxylase
MTRLPPIEPGALNSRQRDLYDDMVAAIEKNFGALVTRRSNGALIGPFNGWLHFPQFGEAAWMFNKALWDHRTLPADIHQLVILVTAAKFGARYQIHGHEYFAARAGVSRGKIAAILAGERPSDLTPAEQIAYDLAAALNRGICPAATTYQMAAAHFGELGVAEIVFLVGCFSMVAITLNAFDAPADETF